MKTLRLTRAESAAYSNGERRFWRAMKPKRKAVRRLRDEEGTEWNSSQWVAVARAEWEKERNG